MVMAYCQITKKRSGTLWDSEYLSYPTSAGEPQSRVAAPTVPTMR